MGKGTAQHLLGYWGYGDQTRLEDWLSQGVNRAGIPIYSRQRSPQGESGIVWGVAGSNSDPSQNCQGGKGGILITTLSASGLSPADAWVALDDRHLTLGREQFGSMPLYWMKQQDIIWFASQVKLLLPLLQELAIDPAAVYGYSCFSYVPTPLTPIAGIAALPAATEQTWTAETGGLSQPEPCQVQEWREVPDQISGEAIAVEHLQTLLQQAIQHQIGDLGQQPVGVFLSGGLDSAIVAALLVRSGIRVRAYSLDFGDPEMSELPYAQRVADHLQIPLIPVDARPGRIRQALLPTAQALDLPFGDGVTVPLFLLGQAASQEVAVVFNGEGGDQLFAGWTNKPLIAAGIYQTEPASNGDFCQQYLRTFHRLWGYEDCLFQPQVNAQIHPSQPQTWIQAALDPAFTTSILHRLRRATLMLKGAQNIQPRATRLAQAHGLRVRSPFCHQPLAEFAFQLAGNLHLQASCEKYILKRTVEPWLPPEIVWRSKRGMGVPLTSWCLNQLWHDLGIWLNPDRLQQEGFWQPDIATRIAAGDLGTIQGRRIGESLWLLLMWQTWRDAVLGENPRSSSLNHPFWLPAILGKQYLRLHRSILPW